MSNEIRWISLKNNGGFAVSIRVKGGSASFNTSTFPVGQERTVDLADAVGKIKDGDIVYLEAVVKAGKNSKASERFIYRKASNQKARYTIKGTTLKPKLTYNGISDQYIKITEPIRGISLKNNGGFVTRIRVKGEIGSYDVGQDICLGQEHTIDLAEAVGKIKDGDEVWLEAVVKAGKNSKASERFVYRKSSNNRACYTIKGTTLNNTMSYNRIEGYYVKMSDSIRCISLKNDGGFVARITIKGGLGSYNVSQDICVTQEKRIDLADVGTVKDGDEVWLEAVVRGGKNNTPRQRFVYKSSSDNKACYAISGTTQINTLSYNGTFKIGVMPKTPATYNGIISKINDWEKRRTACAWPGIEKREIIDGLKAIADCYFNKSYGYTLCRDLKGGDSSDIYSGIYQGDGFPICGPVAVMFYLAKLNISTFVDTITTLYETGSLMGYSVPYSLRKIDKDNNKIEEKYKCIPYSVSNVCWMFQSSIAQKESILEIKLESSSIKMHTRHDEMEEDINYVFNTHNLRHQLLAAWSTVNKSMNNLDEWMKCLNNSGSVLWMMHSTALKNSRDGKNDDYNHVGLIDLHWVVVFKVQKTSTNVVLDLHSWGKLYRITVSHAEFQKMSYLALLFNVK